MAREMGEKLGECGTLGHIYGEWHLVIFGICNYAKQVKNILISFSETLAESFSFLIHTVNVFHLALISRLLKSRHS